MIDLTDHEYRRELQLLPLDVLLDEIEITHLLWLTLKGTPSEAITKGRFDALHGERRRRETVYRKHHAKPVQIGNHPRRPDLKERIAAINDAWPIEQYCEQLLGVRLKQHGRDSLFGACPLPGHDDSSASFHVTPSKGMAWCFGCNRGGDLVKLTQLVFGMTRVGEAVERIEQETGIAA